MGSRELFRRIQDSPAALLISATAIANISVFFGTIIGQPPLLAEVVLGYVPLLVGCFCMWLCILATRRSRHKVLIFLYAVVLAPFAFGYPFWLGELYIMTVTGRYKGPMP